MESTNKKSSAVIIGIMVAVLVMSTMAAIKDVSAVIQHHNGANANGARGSDANGSNGSNGGIGGAGSAGGVAGNGGSNCVGIC